MSTAVDDLIETFDNLFQRAPAAISCAAGRVNLIGEHTDYNQGLVLPVAIDRTATVLASASERESMHIEHLTDHRCDNFWLNDVRPNPVSGWPNYVRGVAWALLGAGYKVSPVDCLITGDVPQGAGLSSSAALEVAVAGALCAISGIEIEPRELALLCQKAENEFVGVRCGIMDQFAAAVGRAGQAMLIDCRSLELEYVPLPSDLAIVVVDSKVQRNLAETPYNLRRQECAKAAEMLGAPTLREVNEHVLEANRRTLPDHLYRRARHVITENERVLAAVDALRRDHLNVLGEMLYRSHASLRDDFEVSCAELDLLVDLACDAECVLGARLTGAGFGGCTVNLVRREAVQEFPRAVLVPYHERTGLAAEMYICKAGDGLRVSHV